MEVVNQRPRKRCHTMSSMRGHNGGSSSSSSGSDPPPGKCNNVYGRSVDVEAQMSPKDSKSRFFDNFPGFARRGRLRQQSLNLDEDLGFPPAHHIDPPEAYPSSARSLPDSAASLRERFRQRSKSDAHPGMMTPRRTSGLIVFFPSNSQEAPRSPGPTNGHDANPLPNGVVSPEFRGNSSPKRPLYVDTQLANGGTQADKKKSPVTHMFDYMRSRTRTNSFSQNHSPGSIVGRTTHSADTMPSPSPRGRPPIVNRYTRVSSSNQKSLDSGLDLNSPTISTTALLIKESTVFSSFDSMTLGAAFCSDVNTVFFESQDGVYSLFMKAHKCYDLIPVSTKLVVFDTHLPVRKAFFALVYNGVRAAPLWDSSKQQFVGMLTITDFIQILYGHYKSGSDEEKMKALEEEEISHWRQKFEVDGILREMVTIDPMQSLHRAVQLLCEHKVHRLPVLDRSSGNISYILTHKRLIKFLSLYIHDLPKPSFMEKTPRELGIGSWGDVLTVHTDTPLIDALKTFLKNRVSALPLVDGDGKVVDIYAKFDVIALAADKVYENLDVTVHEALRHRSDWFEGVHCCRETDTLFSVLETIVRAEVHRLIVTDADKRVVGVVSLSDILKFLVLDSEVKSEPMDAQPTDYSPPLFGTLEEEDRIE